MGLPSLQIVTVISLSMQIWNHFLQDDTSCIIHCMESFFWSVFSYIIVPWINKALILVTLKLFKESLFKIN